MTATHKFPPQDDPGVEVIDHPDLEAAAADLSDESTAQPFIFQPMLQLRNWLYGPPEDEEEEAEKQKGEEGEVDPLLNTIDTLTSPQEPELVEDFKNMTNTIIKIIRKDYFENEFKIENYIEEAPEDYDYPGIDPVNITAPGMLSFRK